MTKAVFEPTFRAASRDDVHQLLALYRQLASQVTPPTTGQVGEALERTGAAGGTVWLALDGATVVATMLLYILPALGDRCRPLAVVEDVVVDESRRGEGIGRLLMEHARALARAAGCYKLMLSSNNRRSDAHRFYEGIGFERHGVSFAIEI